MYSAHAYSGHILGHGHGHILGHGHFQAESSDLLYMSVCTGKGIISV